MGKEWTEEQRAAASKRMKEMNAAKKSAEIKDRIRSQAQLQQSKSRLQAVFDSISEPLILLNEEMVVKMLNKTAAGYYGLSEYRDLLDSKCHQMLRSSHEPCEGCEIPTAVVSGKSMAFERKGFMDPDRLEQVVIYPVQEKGGDSQDYLLRISDITNQRMFEKEGVLQPAQDRRGQRKFFFLPREGVCVLDAVCWEFGHGPGVHIHRPWPALVLSRPDQSSCSKRCGPGLSNCSWP